MTREEQAIKINEKWMQTDTDDSLEIFAYKIGRADAIEEFAEFVDCTDRHGIDYGYERKSNADFYNGFDERNREIDMYIEQLKEHKK